MSRPEPSAGTSRPKGSEYIRWAKSRERFRFNVGRSSVRACSAELLAAGPDDWGLHGPNADGWLPLREAIATRHGVDAEQIALTPGASMAAHLACATLLDPGDHVLVEQPGYEPLRAVPRYLGCEVEALPRRTTDWSVDLGALSERLRPETALVVLSNLHNPTGALIPEETFGKLARLAESHGFDVLVDEVYLEFSGTLRSAAALSPRFVAVSSLTKCYGLDGLRAGWLIGAPEIARRARALNDLFGIIMPHPSERLARRALERAAAIRADVDRLVTTNREFAASFVAGRDDLAWQPPGLAPIGFVHCAYDVDAVIATLEREHDTTAPPGRFFGCADHFRLAFGMETADLRTGLDNLEHVLDRFRAEGTS